MTWSPNDPGHVTEHNNLDNRVGELEVVTVKAVNGVSPDPTGNVTIGADGVSLDTDPDGTPVLVIGG